MSHNLAVLLAFLCTLVSAAHVYRTMRTTAPVREVGSAEWAMELMFTILVSVLPALYLAAYALR